MQLSLRNNWDSVIECFWVRIPFPLCVLDSLFSACRIFFSARQQILPLCFIYCRFRWWRETKSLSSKNRDPREWFTDLIFQGQFIYLIFLWLTLFNWSSRGGVVSKNMPTPSREIRVWEERGTYQKKGLMLGNWSCGSKPRH